jgi:FAD:protein FMN transferase
VRAGYSRSLVGRPRADLAQALAAAPPTRPGAPNPAADWRRIRIDDRAGTVIRPPGVRIDVGGSAKGLAADRAAALLAPHGPCAADVGGDMRVHGTHPVLVHNPLADTSAHRLELIDEAVATSGIDRRLWWERGHRPAHHLLDPATGQPAWTGVLTATARAPSAALAEALAKAAVLAGPARAPAVLARYGGVVIATDGAVVIADPQLAKPPPRRQPMMTARADA